MKLPTKPSRFFFFLLQGLAIAVCLNAGKQAAQNLPLDENLINVNSEKGETYLIKSKARTDYLPLAMHFVRQDNLAYCGVASMVMVLNALDIAAPETAEYRKFNVFTQQNFFKNPKTETVIAQEKVAKMGMTLEQLSKLLETYPVQTKHYHGGNLSQDRFRRLIVENLQQDNNFVLVNYLRSAIDQKQGGHISPIAAYHEPSDRVLILDVARYKYPPVWVKLEDLWRAAQTKDGVSGKTRGIVVVNPSSQQANRAN